jgi:predicted glycosyltransferase
MAGYNTVSELMRARKPALLVPRAGPSQEQLIRARGLMATGLQDMLHPAELSPAALRRSLDRLLERRFHGDLPPHYNGTERAARILAEMAGDTAARGPAQLRAVGADSA